MQQDVNCLSLIQFSKPGARVCTPTELSCASLTTASNLNLLHRTHKIMVIGNSDLDIVCNQSCTTHIFGRSCNLDSSGTEHTGILKEAADSSAKL